MCVCVCVSYPAPQYILYVLVVTIPDTPDSRRRKNSPPVSMSCVDVLRPGYSQPKHPFRSDRLSSLGGRLGISRAGRLHRHR